MLHKQQSETARLDVLLAANLKGLGFDRRMLHGEAKPVDVISLEVFSYA
ncbi:MAG: hypothetical protein HC802_09995 [Caldilineaceae bacterium]|nr:hypothetical protein [Caldilineaceae bacterium]